MDENHIKQEKLPRNVSQIKGKKFEKGKFYYRVKFDDEPEKFHWMLVDRVLQTENGKKIAAEFEASHKDRPVNPKNRRIEQIYGIVKTPSNDKKYFVVKFIDSDDVDVVPRNFLVKHSIDSLLAFYESFMKMGDEEKVEKKRIKSTTKKQRNKDKQANNEKNNEKTENVSNAAPDQQREKEKEKSNENNVKQIEESKEQNEN